MTPLKQPHGPVILGAVNKHLATFQEYPPRAYAMRSGDWLDDL